MIKLRYILFVSFTFCFLFFSFSSKAQQLKLGSNPTQIEKSAVLQMDSKNQGVLLPRVPDFTQMASTTIPDGMIVYYTDVPTNSSYDGPGLYIRKDGAWKKLVVEDENGIETINGDDTKNQTFTVINGNSYNNPDPPTYHEPTIVNDLAGSHILYLPYASNGFDGLVSNNMQTWVGEKRFKDFIGVESLSPGSVPFIGPDDYNYLSEDNTNFFWDNVNNKLNLSGLKFTNLFSTTTPVAGGAIGVDANGNVVRVKGTEDLVLDDNAGADPASGSGQGLNIDNTDPTKTTLNIPDADVGVRGVVNTDAQTFGGDKTFDDNVTVKGTTQVGSDGTPLSYIIKRTASPEADIIIPGSSYKDVSFAISDATIGATVMVSPSQALPPNCAIGYAWVSVDGTVEVRFMNNNETTYKVDPITVLNITISLLGISETYAAEPITLSKEDYSFYFTIIR